MWKKIISSFSNLWKYIIKHIPVWWEFIKLWWGKFITWRKARMVRFRGLPWYRKLGNIAFTSIWMFLLFLFLVDINFLWLFGKSPSLYSVGHPDQNLASEIISADGKVIGKYFTENRMPVEYKDISPIIIKTLVATEDERFYQHFGVSPRGVASAGRGFGDMAQVAGNARVHRARHAPCTGHPCERDDQRTAFSRTRPHLPPRRRPIAVEPHEKRAVGREPQNVTFDMRRDGRPGGGFRGLEPDQPPFGTGERAGRLAGHCRCPRRGEGKSRAESEKSRHLPLL